MTRNGVCFGDVNLTRIEEPNQGIARVPFFPFEVKFASIQSLQC